MSVLITKRFYIDWEPATWLSPTIDIVRESDSSIIISGAPMTEITLGLYKYIFEEYQNSETYFFLPDWWPTVDDRYGEKINDLDSYQNKIYRWKSPNVILDTKEIAKDILNAKVTNFNKVWTFGAAIQKEVSFVDIILTINEINNSAKQTIEYMQKEIIASMKLLLKKEKKEDKKEKDLTIEDIEQLLIKREKKEDDKENEVSEEEKQIEKNNLLLIKNIWTLQNIEIFVKDIYKKIDEYSRWEVIEMISKSEILRLFDRLESFICTWNENWTKISKEIWILKNWIINLSSKIK